MQPESHRNSTSPTRTRVWARLALAFACSTVVAVVWGSLVQTQFNIAALNSLGAGIGGALRLQMSATDLLGFTPIYTVIAGCGLIIALPVASSLQLRTFLPFGIWFVLAGFIGVLLAIQLVNALAPPPTLIAATRTLPGLVDMALGGALAGIVWFRMLARGTTKNGDLR